MPYFSVVGKPRKQKSKKSNKETRELKNSWEKLLVKYGAVPNKRKTFRPLDVNSLGMNKVYSLVKDRLPSKVPSVVTLPKIKPTQKIQYTGEMAIREKLAKQRTFIVAPVANKMGYQLITDLEDIKTMGRKL